MGETADAVCWVEVMNFPFTYYIVAGNLQVEEKAVFEGMERACVSILQGLLEGKVVLFLVGLVDEKRFVWSRLSLVRAVDRVFHIERKLANV